MEYRRKKIAILGIGVETALIGLHQIMMFVTQSLQQVNCATSAKLKKETGIVVSN